MACSSVRVRRATCFRREVCGLTHWRANRCASSIHVVGRCGGLPLPRCQRLEQQSGGRATVIEDSSMRAGSVYHDIVKYVESAQDDQNQDRGSSLEGVIADNVLGLAFRSSAVEYSNVDHCVARLKDIGWLRVAFTLESSLFWNPCLSGPCVVVVLATVCSRAA